MNIIGSVGIRVIPVLDEDANRLAAAQMKQQMEAAQHSVTSGMASSANAATAINQARQGSIAAQTESIMAQSSIVQAALEAKPRTEPFMTRSLVGKEIRSLIGNEVDLQQSLIEDTLGQYGLPFSTPRKKFRSEIEDWLKESASQGTRMLFRRNIAGGNADDAFADLGDDFFNFAEMLGDSQGKMAAVAAKKSHDPYARHLGELYEEIGKTGFDVEKIDPSTLKPGHKYKSAGHEFFVDQDEDEQRIIRSKSSKFSDLPVDAISGPLRIDYGSLRHDEPAMPDGDFLEGLEGSDKPTTIRVDATAAKAEIRELRNEIELTKAAAENAIILHPTARSTSPLELTHVGARPDVVGTAQRSGFTEESIAAIAQQNQRAQELRALGYDPKVIAQAEQRAKDLKGFESQLGENPGKFAKEIQASMANNLVELGFQPDQFDEHGRFKTPTAEGPLVTPAPSASIAATPRTTPTSRPRPVVTREASPYRSGLLRMPDEDDRGIVSDAFGNDIGVMEHLATRQSSLNERMSEEWGAPRDLGSWDDYFESDRFKNVKKKGEYGEFLRAARSGGSRGGGNSWLGGGGGSGLLTQLGGRAGTGLMMSAMFGGWEVATAAGAAVDFYGAHGSPTEILEQQLASTQMMRQGPLGSIGGMIVDPLHTAEKYAQSTLQGITASEQGFEIRAGLSRYAQDTSLTARMASMPKGLQGVAGIYNDEQKQVEELQKIRTTAGDAADREYQAEIARVENSQGSFGRGVNWIRSANGLDPDAEYMFFPGVGKEKRAAEDGKRQAIRGAESRYQEAFGAVGTLKTEKLREFTRDYVESSWTDIGSFGAQSKLAQFERQRDAELGRMDESIKNETDEEKKKSMQVIRDSYAKSSDVTDQMLSIDAQYAGRDSFETNIAAERAKNEVILKDLRGARRFKEADAFQADADRTISSMVRRQGSFAIGVATQAQVIRASATPNPFDEEEIAISEEAEQSELDSTDNEDQKKAIQQTFRAKRESLKVRKERFNRLSRRDAFQQEELVDMSLAGGSREDVMARHMLREIQNDVSDLYEAGFDDQAKDKLRLGRKQLELARDDFYGSFDFSASSPLYTGFQQKQSDPFSAAIKDLDKSAPSLDDIKNNTRDMASLMGQFMQIFTSFVNGAR